MKLILYKGIRDSLAVFPQEPQDSVCSISLGYNALRLNVDSYYTQNFLSILKRDVGHVEFINPLTPTDHYNGRTAPLTSKRCILYIYSTNIGTEYFKHGIYSPFFSLQNTVCFIILTYLVPVLFTFCIQSVLKIKKKKNSGAKKLSINQYHVGYISVI